MDQGAFAYPKLHYFKSGNPYTGSFRGLNYMLEPLKDKETGEETLKISVWYGPFCSTASEMVATTTLPLTQDALEESREYLWEQYRIFEKKTVEQTN